MSANVVSLIGTKRALLYAMTVEQGVDLEFPITLVDAAGDVESAAGYTAKLQVRKYTESETVLWEMTTENNRISTADGKITLKFSKDDFIAVNWRTGVYDLKITSTSLKVERLMEGQFIIDPEVTR